MENKVNEILESVKENKILELREVVKLIQDGISIEDFNKFISELSKISEMGATSVSAFVARHLYSIKEGASLDELIKKDNDNFYVAYDAELAEKLKIDFKENDIILTCGEDMKITEEIEDKLTKIREDIENGKAEEVLNSEFGKSLATVLANDLVQTKAMIQQHGCDCCKSHNSEVYDDGEIEDQVNDICEKIKCDEDRLQISCIVGNRLVDNRLIDGINCNIFPIGLLGVVIITNIGLEVEDIVLDKSMNTIDDIIVLLEEGDLGAVTLYELLEAGLAITISVEDLNNVVKFSPVEFRGITKLVDYSEMSKLLN